MFVIKLIMLGDSYVGKTSILDRFIHNTFDVHLISGLAVDFGIQQIVVDGITYKFQLWDTWGQERFRAMVRSYYRGVSAAIIVYDVTNRHSFGNLKMWIADVKKYALPNVVIAIAGNKNDLDDKREVPEAEGREYANSMDSIFMETSAKTGANISEIFTSVAKWIPPENLRIPDVMEYNVPYDGPPCCGS